MKKYLSIETARKENNTIRTVSVAKFLLSENISGWLYEEAPNITRVYFLNANPFAFILLYISEESFLRLCREKTPEKITKQANNSIFIYSVIEL